MDLDARGGALYSVFVVSIMAGTVGPKSIDVPIGPFVRVVGWVSGVGAGRLDETSLQIRDEGQRMVPASQALELYPHTNATALLMSFVGLSTACQIAGHKPSWFDAEDLVE